MFGNRKIEHLLKLEIGIDALQRFKSSVLKGRNIPTFRESVFTGYHSSEIQLRIRSTYSGRRSVGERTQGLRRWEWGNRSKYPVLAERPRVELRGYREGELQHGGSMSMI